MTNVAGTTKFTTQALQSSGTAVMRVTVYGYPPTGDLQKVIVEQDLTGKGSYTYAATFPPNSDGGKMISTVCADGYVQCDPGTNSHCQFRAWSTHPDGGIVAEVAGDSADGSGNINSLSSCYCFNKYCSKNNNAILDIDNITANVGGSILAAYLAQNTGMAVSRAQSMGSGVIVYYGIKASAVHNGADPSRMTASQIADMPVMYTADPATIQSYYQDPGSMGSLADTASQQQHSSPNSLYNMVANVSNNITGTTTSCTNLLTPTLSVKQRTFSQSGGKDGSISFCADDRGNAVLTQYDYHSFAFGVEGTGPGGDLWRNCGGWPTDPLLRVPAQPMDKLVFTPPAATTAYKITSVSASTTMWGGGCDNTGTGAAMWTPSVGLGQPIVAQTSLTCHGHENQQPRVSWDLTLSYDSQEVVTDQNMGCKQLESDANCSVQQESWDSRPVRVNGLPTGFAMGAICQDLSGPAALRSIHYCTPPDRPWFRQDKTFFCKNANPYDFSGVQKRIKGIQDSTKMPNSNTMTYTENGVTMTYGVPAKGSPDTCSQVCETKVPTNSTPVNFTATPRTDLATAEGVAKQAFDTFYKDCLPPAAGSTTWTCPVDASKGEVVVTQCGCGNDMGKAIGALEAADNAAQDSICSKE